MVNERLREQLALSKRSSVICHIIRQTAARARPTVTSCSEQCPVCLEPFSSKPTGHVWVLHCGHVFCQSCLCNFAATVRGRNEIEQGGRLYVYRLDPSSCPVCRELFLPNDQQVFLFSMTFVRPGSFIEPPLPSTAQARVSLTANGLIPWPPRASNSHSEAVLRGVMPV